MTMAAISNRTNNILLVACSAAFIVMAGCQMPSATTPPTGKPLATGNRPSQAVDDCASRLHDICGQLLLYYSVKGSLPQKLEEIAKVSDEPLPPLVCPISQKPYTYNREGLVIAGFPGRAVIYDSEPAHSGNRWAIVIEPIRPGKPLVARVMQLPAERTAPQAGLNSQPAQGRQR